MHLAIYSTTAGLPAVVLQASPAKAATKAMSPASSWALRALKQNSSKQTHMLESLLMQHLQKQLLLTGNPIIVPVLGHCCVFRSVHVTVHAVPATSAMPSGRSACFLTFAMLQYNRLQVQQLCHLHACSLQIDLARFGPDQACAMLAKGLCCFVISDSN